MKERLKHKFILGVQVSLGILAIVCLIGAIWNHAMLNKQSEQYNETIQNYTIQNKEPASDDDSYTDSNEENLESETDVVEPYVIGADFTALQEQNQDVTGWISIPDTSVNFPFVQGQDNTKYLTIGWDNQWAAAGACFLDSRAELANASKYVIYGHAMPNTGLMFSSVLNYQDSSFLEEHPFIYLSFANDPINRTQTGVNGTLQPEGQYEFQIISVNKVDSGSEDIISDYYWIAEENDAEFQEFASFVRETSLYEIPFEGTPYKYVMLSTCANSGFYSNEKVLVIGVLTEESLEPTSLEGGGETIVE